MYRPNSTLTEEERLEAAGPLQRIESQSSREELGPKVANRIRGGWRSSSSNGYSGSEQEGVRSPPPPPPGLPPSPPRQFHQRGWGRRIPMKQLGTVTATNTGAENEPRSPSLPNKQPKGRSRAESDAEMARLVDLLVNRSSITPYPTSRHHLSGAVPVFSLPSIYSSDNHEGVLSKARHDESDWETNAPSVWTEESARDNNGPLKAKQAIPLDARLREKWNAG